MGMRHLVIPLLLCPDEINPKTGKTQGKEPAQSGFQLPDFEPLDNERINMSMSCRKSNLGTLVGGRTNLLVVDVDNAEEAGDFLVFFATELEQAVCVITPRGGRHYYFLRPVPVDQLVDSNIKEAVPGIDFLADHAAVGKCRYTVIPPSVVYGKPYVWADEGRTLFNTEPAIMSADMLTELTTIRYPKGKSVTINAEGERVVNMSISPLDSDQPVEEGERNETLARAAGAAIMRTGSTDEDVIRETIQPVVDRMADPLPEDEIRTTIRSMCRKDRRDNPQREERPEVTQDDILALETARAPQPVDLGDDSDFAQAVEPDASELGLSLPGPVLVEAIVVEEDPLFWESFREYYEKPRPAMAAATECINWMLANVFKDGLVLLEDTYYARIKNREMWAEISRTSITSKMLEAFPQAKKAWLESNEYILKNKTWGPRRDLPHWWSPGLHSNPPAGYPRDPRHLIPFPNGLLDVSDKRTFTLRPHSARLITLSQMPFGYDPDARCPRWIQFLRELWDSETSDRSLALQRWFGYCLVPDTSQHKMGVLHGPRRAGKSLIGKILHSLIGKVNTEASNLTTLTSPYGLCGLVGKLLTIMYDAHLPHGPMGGPTIELLKSLSAGDPQPINRKYHDTFTAALPTRILLICNEIPKLEDAGSALAARMLPIRCDRSWFGKEDTQLEDKLLLELPGICNWALHGLRDYLNERRLIVPATAIEDLQLWRRATNHICAWVDDAAILDEADTHAPEYCETSHDLFASWLAWCVKNNVKATGTQARFEDRLRSVSPHLRYERRGVKTVFVGIRLTREPVQL